MGMEEERIRKAGLDFVGRKKKLKTSCASSSGDGLLFVGMVLPLKADGTLLYSGKYGKELGQKEMLSAARCAANGLLRAIADGAGGLDNVASVLTMNVLISCAPGCDDALDKIADEISKTLVEVLGKRGEQARTVLGMCTLEKDAPVSCDAIVALRKERKTYV